MYDLSYFNKYTVTVLQQHNDKVRTFNKHKKSTQNDLIDEEMYDEGEY